MSECFLYSSAFVLLVVVVLFSYFLLPCNTTHNSYLIYFKVTLTIAPVNEIITPVNEIIAPVN